MFNNSGNPENHQLNAQLKVLVIDDEINFTEEIEEFLQNQGYISFTANNVHKGRAILKNQDIDLLILDVRLKGISGLEILKEVKQNYPKLEVIIVSAHGDMDTVINALRNGAIDYLKKTIPSYRYSNCHPKNPKIHGSSAGYKEYGGKNLPYFQKLTR